MCIHIVHRFTLYIHSDIYIVTRVHVYMIIWMEDQNHHIYWGLQGRPFIVSEDSM
jgi:hypothetical protein